MFKISNEELIQIAAVDAGLDPYKDYCTRGMWKNAGYKIKKGEKPVLSLELWCPRERKANGDNLSNGDTSVSDSKTSAEIPGLFFQFKKCNLFSRDQVQDAEEAELEKQAKKIRQAEEKAFRKAVMAQGGIKPCADYNNLPHWCKRHEGVPIDVAVMEVSRQGFYAEDANNLFEMLLEA